MNAMMLTKLRAMEMREVPDPGIVKPDDVRLQLGAVGVCGSDIHYYTTGRIGSQVVEYPFTVGHESAGTVVEVGPAVTHVRPGDRVAIEPAIVCGECDQCRAGRENTCRQNRFLGCPGQIAGCLSNFIVMPEENCFPIQDSTSMAHATISEPLAIGVYAVQQAHLPPHATIGILGMGPIGLTVLLPAQVEGITAAYCTDKIDARCAKSASAGATWVGNPDREDVVKAILDQEPMGLDVVFECCGQQDALDQAIEILRPGGTLMLIGIPEVDRVSFTPDLMRRKEITLVNVRRQRGCVQRALDLIENQVIDVEQLITHRFPFERTKEAFDLVADYQDGVVKAMIEF